MAEAPAPQILSPAPRKALDAEVIAGERDDVWLTPKQLKEIGAPVAPHASTHATDGSDPITPASIGAETPAGAQAKADAVALASVSRAAKAKRTTAPALWDDFDRANGALSAAPANALPSGQTWIVAAGDPVISNGRVFEPNGANFYIFADRGEAIPEAHAAFSLNWPGDSTNFVLHLAAATDLLNMLHLQVRPDGWVLDTRIAGTWANAIASGTRSISVGPSYAMGLRVEGTTVIVIDVDGSETPVEVNDIADMGTLRFLGIQGGICHGVVVGPPSANALVGFGGGSGAAYEVASRAKLGMRKQQKEVTLTGTGWVRIATQTNGGAFGTFAMGGRVRFWAKDSVFSNVSEFELFTEFTASTEWPPLIRLISAMNRFGGSVTQARVSCNAGTGDIGLDLYFARADVTNLVAEFEGGFSLVTTPTVGATALPSVSVTLDLLADDFVGLSGKVNLAGNQNIAGTKTFSTAPVVGTAPLTTRNTSAASTAFVQGVVSTVVDPIANSRAARQALVFDGTGYTPFPCPAFGLTQCAFTFENRSPQVSTALFSLGVDQCVILEAGVVKFRTLNVHENAWVVSEVGNFVVVVDRPNISLYRNGALVSTQTIVGTNPLGAGTYLGAYNATIPVAGYTGITSPVVPYNYALTADQVAALFRDGVPAAVDRGGSMTNKIFDVARNSAFSAGGTDWAGINGGTGTLSAGKLDVDSAASAFGGAQLGNSFTGLSVVAGRRYGIYAMVSNFANSGGVPLLRAYGSANYNVAITASGLAYLEFVATITEPLSILFFEGSGSGSFTLTIDDVLVLDLGTLAQYGPWDGNGGYWPDSNGTPNPAHLVLGAGVQPLIKTVRGAAGVSAFGVAEYAPSRPLLSVTLAAGQVVTAGDVLAEILTGDYEDIGGLFLLKGDRGSKLYFAGGFAGAGSATLVASAGQIDADFGHNMGVTCSAVGNAIRLRIVAAASTTMTSTNTARLYYVATGIPSRFVK